LLLVKKTFKTLQDEIKETKLQIDEYLLKISDTMNLLRDKELQFKQLSNFFEDTELSILKLENVIQEKKIKHIASEETISYWQKKYDCAQASLDNANKMHDANKKTIQELKNELGNINIELMELRETRESEQNIELSNSQVLYIHFCFTIIYYIKYDNL
jgi:chromosome segregation ATPase